MTMKLKKELKIKSSGRVIMSIRITGKPSCDVIETQGIEVEGVESTICGRIKMSAQGVKMGQNKVLELEQSNTRSSGYSEHRETRI